MTQPDPYKTPRALPAAWQTQGDDEPRGSWLKKILMIFGAVFAALIMVAIAGVAVFAYLGTGLDRESKTYVDLAVPAIAGNWEAGELDSRKSAELRAIIKPGEVEKFFSVLQTRLGRLKQYKGARGGSFVGYDLKKGKVVTARYVAQADFEQGRAEILLSLVKRDGDWQITEFRVNSPQLMAAN